MKNDSAFKIVGYSVLGLIVLWIVKAIFFPTGYGVNVRFNMPRSFNNGYEHSYYSNVGVSNLSSTIIQILLVVFIVALVVGAVMLIKNYLFTPEEIATLKGSITGKPNQVTNSCVECGKELRSDWKVCPHCGKDVNIPEKH